VPGVPVEHHSFASKPEPDATLAVLLLAFADPTSPRSFIAPIAPHPRQRVLLISIREIASLYGTGGGIAALVTSEERESETRFLHSMTPNSGPAFLQRGHFLVCSLTYRNRGIVAAFFKLAELRT
jgi:hypothetical protein